MSCELVILPAPSKQRAGNLAYAPPPRDAVLIGMVNGAEKAARRGNNQPSRSERGPHVILPLPRGGRESQAAYLSGGTEKIQPANFSVSGS
jgi:hypothetical protein